MSAIWWSLVGCSLFGGPSGGGAPPPPDPAATTAAVDALCKLAEGAGSECTRETGGAVIGDHELKVHVVLESAGEEFGQFTWSGMVQVTAADGHMLQTRARSYGWSKEEAYERGFHEWALVSGVSLVDWQLGTRAALGAVEADLADEAYSLDGRKVLRGWSLVRGLAEGKIDHGALLETLAPIGKALAPGTPHTVHFVVTADMGAEPTWVCDLDGVHSDELCALAKTYPWPEGIVWEAKQQYLVLP